MIKQCECNGSSMPKLNDKLCASFIFFLTSVQTNFSFAQQDVSRPMKKSSTAQAHAQNFETSKNQVVPEKLSVDNELQSQNKAKSFSKDDFQRLKMVRLWNAENRQLSEAQHLPFQAIDQNPEINLNDSIQKDKLNNSSRYLKAQFCGETGFYSFSKNSSLISDESSLIEPLMTQIKPGRVDRTKQVFKKQMRKQEGRLAKVFSSNEESEYYTDISDDDLNEILQSDARYRDIVFNSSSLVKPMQRVYNVPDYLIRPTNFTVGGWFRADLQETAHQSVMTKYYSGSSGQMHAKEWELFIHGNSLYFHSYRFGTFSVPRKYLSAEEAENFRYENQKYYKADEYYGDAYARLVQEKYQRDNRSLILDHQIRSYKTQKHSESLGYYEEPQLPPQKGDVTKPPVPGRPPSHRPTPLPPMPPLEPPEGYRPPPSEGGIYIPEPPLVYGVIAASISGGKEHTLGFDVKALFHGYSLGSCVGCYHFERNGNRGGLRNRSHKRNESAVYPGYPGERNQNSNNGAYLRDEVYAPQEPSRGELYSQWHYLAISVHQDDRLGPYVDLWYIADPQTYKNAKERGEPVDLQKSIRNVRMKKNVEEFSFLPLNPFQFSYDIEAGCMGQSTSCVSSKFILGSAHGSRGFSGLMKGIFISKKALRQEEAAEVAQKTYPNASGRCGNQ